MQNSSETPIQASGPNGGSPELAKKLRGHWDETRKAERPQRKESEESRAFYSNEQWTREQKARLQENGRPAIAINRIFKAINNLLGKERGGRLDWKVLPRGESDVQVADAMTKTLAYVADASKAPYAISAAFKDASLGPMGWLEIGLRSVKGVDTAFVDHVPTDEVWRDPHSQRLDLLDARYIIRVKWLDLDLAIAAFPEHAARIKAAVESASEEQQRGSRSGWNDGDDYGNRSGSLTELREDDVTDADRKRVRLREHHWWEVEQAEYLVLADGRTYLFEEAMQRPDFLDLLSQGAQRKSGDRRVYKRAIVVGDTVLEMTDSPYPFERFPFVPVWAYVDNHGRPFGVVRMMKDPQREVNTSRSRRNESLRSRTLIRSKDAAPELSDKEIANRLGRANFVLTVADPGGIALGSDKADAAAWAMLEAKSEQDIDDVAGQNEAAYGDKSNEKSGKAIQARVAQQGLNMAELFDNLRFARLLVGEMLLALIQKFYPPQRIARIVEASVLRAGKPVDVSWLNTGYANPIEQMEFDVIIEDQAENASERGVAMDQAIQLVGFLPDPAKAAVAPYVIRMSDFADKDEMADAAERAMAPPAPLGPGMPSGAPPPGVPLPGAGAPALVAPQPQ